MTGGIQRKFPCEVKVRELISSRYADNKRPIVWEERRAGIDLIRIDPDETLRLQSDGQQSPPEAGWRLVLCGGDEERGYRWTLSGMED